MSQRLSTIIVSNPFLSPEQLWRAPELLGNSTRGTFKGDVYSFAIICSEILTREDPYAMYELDIDGKKGGSESHLHDL